MLAHVRRFDVAQPAPPIRGPRRKPDRAALARLVSVIDQPPQGCSPSGEEDHLECPARKSRYAVLHMP